MDGPDGNGIRDRSVGVRGLHRNTIQQHHGYPATCVRVRKRAAVRDVSAGNVLEARDRTRRLRGPCLGDARSSAAPWVDAAYRKRRWCEGWLARSAAHLS